MKRFLSKKPIFLITGLINFGLFHFAIFRLFVFLYDSSNRQTIESIWLSILINFVLLMFFTIPHSLLLESKVKEKILRYVPNRLYSTFYSLHACIGIILLDSFWVDMGGSIYQLHGDVKHLFDVLYVFSWLFMFYAMVSTGLFRQSGIEEWFKALKGKPMKYDIKTHGAYSLCRHPIYAAFIAMIWTTPNLTFDHLFLSVIWTVYILWGAGQKERRLIRNKSYQDYARNVVAFPFLNKFLDNGITKYLWRIQL